MKIWLIIGLCALSVQMCFSQVTDTLGYSEFQSGTPVLYNSPNGGYAFGNNGYGDKAKAQTYSHETPFVLRKVLLLFGDVVFESADSSSVIRVNLYDNYGFGVTSVGQSDSIAPDSIIAFVDIPVYDLLDDGNFTEASFIHDTIVVRNQFSVGIDLTMLSAGDTVGLISTSDGDATGSYSAWELTANNEWFTVEHGVYSWGLEVDLAIFPVIDADDPAGVINMRDGLLSVYPNPCNDILFINVPNSDMSQVSIHDLTGRNITDQITIRGKNSIDVSQLNTGFYVITVSDAQFSRSTKILKAQ